MIKRLILLIFLSIGSCAIFAQTGPQFTQYIFNHFYLNPGATGITKKTNIQVTARSQYSGYKADQDLGGNIFSSVVSADLPFAKLKGGVGMYVSQNTFSKVQSEQQILLSYALHKKISNNILGLGVAAGLSNLNLQGENFRPRDPGDLLIPSTSISSLSPTINVGAFLYNPNYQLGLSVKNLIKPTFTFADNEAKIADREKVFLTGKVDFGVTYTLDISPMFIIKSDLITVSSELGVLASYNQKFWGGINYRWQDAASLLAGANLLNNNLKIGLAFDFVSFGADAKAVSSQEIFLRYVMNAPKLGKKSIIRTPRYSL